MFERERETQQGF